MARLLIILAFAAFAAACGPPAASSGGAGDGGATTPAPASDEPTPAPTGGTATSGMCAAEMPDCVDTVTEPAKGHDAELRAAAKDLLGVAEDDVPAHVRIGRRGDEQFALTEDYQVGRMTVELDQDVDSIYRVTAVTVELAEGPRTFTAREK